MTLNKRMMATLALAVAALATTPALAGGKVQKTLTINGQPHSVSLTQQQWSKLEAAAKKKGMSVDQLATRIAAKRGHGGAKGGSHGGGGAGGGGLTSMATGMASDVVKQQTQSMITDSLLGFLK